MATRKVRKPETVAMQRVYDLLEPFEPVKAARIVELVCCLGEVGREPTLRIAKILEDIGPDVRGHVVTWLTGRFGTPLPVSTIVAQQHAVGEHAEAVVGTEQDRRLPRDIGRQPVSHHPV